MTTHVVTRNRRIGDSTPSQVSPMPTGPPRRLDDDSGHRNDLLSFLSNPADPRFQAAMRKTCEVCHAKPDHPCRNTIDDGAPLPGRLIHIGRIEYCT